MSRVIGLIVVFAVGFLVGGCANFGGNVADSHGLDAWSQKKAIFADFTLVFGEPMRIETTFLTDLSRAHVEFGDMGTIVWDGSQCWVSPFDSEIPMPRFQARTWPYFIAAPFKLNDPGSTLEPTGKAQLLGEPYDTARLTFEAGVGDTPDDWYVLYMHPVTGQLKAMAYIVTYYQDTETANAKPHAILYRDFREVDGVTLAHAWEFYLWSQEQGIYGDAIASAKFHDIRFVYPPEDLFNKPVGSKLDRRP